MNSSTSIVDQIKIFNEFDILITPHGSHLANGIFTLRPGNKAILEVIPFAFDRVFYSNFNMHLEFGVYMLSTGHLTPLQEETNGTHCYFDSVSKFWDKNASCSVVHHSYPNKPHQHFLVCSSNYQPRMCDTWVNTTLLKEHLFDMFNNSLCRPNNGLPPPAQAQEDMPPEPMGPP